MSLLAASPVLKEIFTRSEVLDAKGIARPIHSDVGQTHAEALYRAVLAERPTTVIEIGMAFGISSLSMLTALRDCNGEGRLISIDPFQYADYDGIGLSNVARAGLTDRQELIQSPDYFALPKLLENGTRIQFAYVDGWHTFDYTLLDFFYLDKMLDAGGVIAFNDAGWQAVHKVLKFVTSHRRYEEIDVGLARYYPRRNPFTYARRRLEGRSDPDRYFRKIEQFEPSWDFFAPF